MIHYKKTLAILLTATLFLPALTSAQGILPSCVTGSGNGTTCGFQDLIELVNLTINWFIGVSIAVAAVTFSIAGGIMLFNPGNAAKRTEAIGMFKKTVIGLVFVLAAWLIVHTIVSALVSGGNPFLFIGR